MIRRFIEKVRETMMAQKRHFWMALLAGGLSACAGTRGAKVEPTLADAVTRKVLTADDSFAQGVALFEAGKYIDAQVMFEETLGKSPKMVAAQYNLGVVFERQGELAQAEKSYEVALQLDPGHLPSLLNLGKVYRQAEKLDQASALFETALKSPGKEYDVSLLNALTAVYRQGKKYELAEITDCP